MREGSDADRRPVDKAIETAIRKALEKGDAGIQKIATKFGVGTGTVQRIKGRASCELTAQTSQGISTSEKGKSGLGIEIQGEANTRFDAVTAKRLPTASRITDQVGRPLGTRGEAWQCSFQNGPQH